MCLSTPSVPSIPTPPPPTVDTTNSNSSTFAAAATAEQQKAALAQGQSSTILTSGMGVQGNAPTNKPTLLGQSS